MRDVRGVAAGARAHLLLKVRDDLARRVRQAEVQGRRDDQRFGDAVGRALDGVDGGHDVLHADGEADGGFLDDGDEFVGDGRQDVADGLRQDNEAHGLQLGHAERTGGLGLAAVDRLDARADDLRQIRAGVERQRHHAGEEPLKADEAEEHEARQNLHAVEQAVVHEPDLHDHRRCAEQLDIDGQPDLLILLSRMHCSR